MKSPFPANYLDLPADEQRRLRVEYDAAKLLRGDPNVWLDLLLGSVKNDPHIPEAAKTLLCRRLIETMRGIGSLDPISPERRHLEDDDMAVYTELHHAGGTLTSATKAVAGARGVSVSTIRRAYERHIARWPSCQRLDGRRKKRKPQAQYIRG